jgi:hypothetical protein
MGRRERQSEAKTKEMDSLEISAALTFCCQQVFMLPRSCAIASLTFIG